MKSKQLLWVAALGMLSAAAGAPTNAAEAAKNPVIENSMVNLQSEFAFEIRVALDKVMIIGDSSYGLRRVVPIVGGTVAGANLNGKVVPGGADWQFVRADGAVVVDAKYTLQTDDGVLIMITNKGIRRGPKEVIERLTRGEKVDPKEYYFRTVAEFEAPRGSKYEWLNQSLFIGVAERQADAAVIRFFQLK